MWRPLPQIPTRGAEVEWGGGRGNAGLGGTPILQLQQIIWVKNDKFKQR